MGLAERRIRETGNRENCDGNKGKVGTVNVKAKAKAKAEAKAINIMYIYLYTYTCISSPVPQK